MTLLRRFTLAALLLLNQSPVSAEVALLTHAEQTQFRETGRYAEVIALCTALQQAYPKAARCIEFGRSPQGRPLQALIVSTSGALTPAAAQKRQLPVLLVQGGIHAGEIDGKDAGFISVREALAGRLAKGALKKQVLVFVPVFNVDGHERFGRNNRPNQRGPEQMGWRTTAQNYNLNRDYAKADAPEMQAMLALVEDWDPLLTVDLHVTDGAQFEHDVAIQVEPLHAGDAELAQAGGQLRDGVHAGLRESGSLPLPFYPSFVVNDDPASGFTDGVAPPRFSTGYFWLRNRFAMLVETHSWKDYATRVSITRHTIAAVLEQIAEHGRDWQQLAQAADRRAATLADQAVALTYRATDKVRSIEFRGYAYTRSQSEVSGALMTHYDESKPQIWTLPLRDEIVPDLSVVAPTGGYLVSVQDADWVAAKLKLHGIAFSVLKPDIDPIPVQVFRAESVNFSAQSIEGHQRADITGSWRAEAQALPAGSLFVPIAQPKARLLMSLLEPTAPDSLAAWGEFNNAFEQKEYMEDYVAEAVARDQLAADPALAAQFQKQLDEDAVFAASPAARLQFFARRHASWDDHFMRYPVFRTALTAF